jgi:hypothetical protein
MSSFRIRSSFISTVELPRGIRLSSKIAVLPVDPNISNVSTENSLIWNGVEWSFSSPTSIGVEGPSNVQGVQGHRE